MKGGNQNSGKSKINLIRCHFLLCKVHFVCVSSIIFIVGPCPLLCFSCYNLEQKSVLKFSFPYVPVFGKVKNRWCFNRFETVETQNMILGLLPDKNVEDPLEMLVSS